MTRAVPAYMLFVKSVRPSVKTANPEATFGELGKLLGEQWKALSEPDRQVYKDQSAKLKEAADAAGGDVEEKPKKVKGSKVKAPKKTIDKEPKQDVQVIKKQRKPKQPKPAAIGVEA